MPEFNAAWRRSNIGYLLFAASAMFVREKLRAVHAAGFVRLSDPQLALFVNIEPGGTRLTALAARAGLTKPSVVELVDRTETMGLVERRPDPEDKRGRIVQLTTDGRQVVEVLRRAIIDGEERFVALFGGAFTDDFKLRFGTYSSLPVTGEDAPEDTGDVRDAIPWRTGNLGRVLALASRRFARDALGVVHQHGWHEVSAVLLRMFRNLDLEGTRLTELAARAQMTKQSMRELVDRAEKLGLVAREPDPLDRRAKTIVFSPAGLVMLEQVRIGIAQAEVRAEAAMGREFLAEARTRLLSYTTGYRPT